MRVQITNHFNQARRAGKTGAGRGLFLAAEYVLGESQRQVPLDEGPLQQSGVASVDEGQLVAAVSYDTVYAARQHEELGWRHKAGRKAKYLEHPLTQTRPQQGRIIAGEVKKELGS